MEINLIFDSTWVIAAFIVVLAACIQSVTGFGFAVLSVPLFLLIFDAKTAVGLSMLISFFTVSNLTFRVHKSIIRPLVKNLLIGAIFGLPVGIYIFYNFDLKSLKLMISIVVTLLSLFLLSGFRLKLSTSNWVDRMIGSISGVMTSSIGMPGPPIVLSLNNREIPKDEFRATIACYNALVYVFSIIFLLLLGSISISIIITALTLVPLGLLGGFLGSYIFTRVSQAHFQRGVPILLLVSALYSFLQ